METQVDDMNVNEEEEDGWDSDWRRKEREGGGRLPPSTQTLGHRAALIVVVTRRPVGALASGRGGRVKGRITAAYLS